MVQEVSFRKPTVDESFLYGYFGVLTFKDKEYPLKKSNGRSFKTWWYVQGLGKRVKFETSDPVVAIHKAKSSIVKNYSSQNQ